MSIESGPLNPFLTIQFSTRPTWSRLAIGSSMHKGNRHRRPGVNHLGTYGRWAFGEFIDVYESEEDFKTRVA